VEPAAYALGDCFTDFDPEALKSTVVPCDTGHSAQLVAVFRYPAEVDYPGAEALKAKALESLPGGKTGTGGGAVYLELRAEFSQLHQLGLRRPATGLLRDVPWRKQR
jgi:hypothetical protein